MKRMIWLRYVLLTLALLLTGCNRPQTEVVLSPAVPPQPVMETAAPVNTLPPELPTPVPTSPPPAEISVIDTSGWVDYANDAYGFSFRYPADWTVEPDQRPDSNMAQHLLWLRPQQLPGIEMSVAFKRLDEDLNIKPTGMGGGDLVEGGVVLFIGQEIPRQRLVALEKDMSIFYNNTLEIQRGNLVFLIRLNYIGAPTDAVALPADIEMIADQIVASFQLSPSS